MLVPTDNGPKPDIDLEGFKDGRFFILGLIVWIATMQVGDVVLSYLRGGSAAVAWNIVSLVFILLVLYLLYRGKKVAHILVIIMMMATSLVGIYRGVIGYPGHSTLRMIHAGLLLVGAAALWFWKPALTFLAAQRKGIDPRYLTRNFPDDISWFFPPRDVHNADAWDTYWKNQLNHGLGPKLFDIFCRDDDFVKAAQTYGLSTVLCVGNGISQEPVALSRAGFLVTAMDISPLAVAVCQKLSERFSSSDHYFDQSLRRPGGSVKFVVGDIFNESDCPGPYDMVIERRTIQDYPQEQQNDAVARVIARLADRGILVSHCHDNKYSPISSAEALPKHATKPLITKQGIRICGRDWPTSLDHRIAVVQTASG